MSRQGKMNRQGNGGFHEIPGHLQHTAKHLAADAQEVEFAGADGRAREESGGCGLKRLVSTFTSPDGQVSPEGGVAEGGICRRRCLVGQAVSAAWAARYSAWYAKAEGMASLMRRTLVRTSAPILSSLRRMVPQEARAN
jgi:hypothetical protein